MSMGLNFSLAHLVLHRVTDLGGGLAPDLDLLLTPLVVGDDAALVLALDLVGLGLEVLEQRRLARPASCTSAMEMVRPERVANSKPRSLSLSRLSATTARG